MRWVLVLLVLAALGCSHTVVGGGFETAGAGGEAASAGQPGVGGDGSAASDAGGTGAGGDPAGGSAGTALTGGAGSVGGAVATGGAPGGAPSTGGTAGNDYLISGPWHGYVSPKVTGTGSTITPESFATGPQNGPYCVSGSIGPMPNFSGTGSIVFNVNQAQVPASPVGTLLPAGAGIYVSVANSSASVLRLQIEGPSGAQRWCVTLNGSGYYAYSKFNTACWDTTTGTYYNGSDPISTVTLLVPGGNLNPVPFSFCLNLVVESNG